MMYQTESGTQCPQTMTYACVPALRFMRPEDKAICECVGLQSEFLCGY